MNCRHLAKTLALAILSIGCASAPGVLVSATEGYLESYYQRDIQVLWEPDCDLETKEPAAFQAQFPTGVTVICNIRRTGQSATADFAHYYFHTGWKTPLPNQRGTAEFRQTIRWRVVSWNAIALDYFPPPQSPSGGSS